METKTRVSKRRTVNRVQIIRCAGGGAERHSTMRCRLHKLSTGLDGRQECRKGEEEEVRRRLSM